MSRLKTLRQACIEVCAVAEVLHRLGIDYDQIHFVRAENSQEATPGLEGPRFEAGDFFVEVRRLDKPPFRICVDNPERKRKDWREVLSATMVAWNEGRYHSTHWTESEAKRRAIDIAALLVAAGFKIKQPEIKQ